MKFIKINQGILMAALLNFFFSLTSHVYADGVVNRVQQQKQAVAQQMIQQRQMQEQQMMMQVRQQQELLLQRRAMQQAVRQKQAQQMVEQQMAVGQAMRQRAQTQAYMQQQEMQMAKQVVAKEKALQESALWQQQQAAQTAMLQDAAGNRIRPETPQETWNRVNDADAAGPTDVVGMKEIWDELKISSEVWPLIIDTDPKQIIVLKYIEWYRKQGIMIRKDAGHYVSMIDGMSRENPTLLQQPFSNLLKLVAIIEYDFDNGQDRDRLAKQVLGDKLHQENRKRLGL